MKCIRRSPIAFCLVRARGSGLCASADGRMARRGQSRVRPAPGRAGGNGGVGRRPRRRPSTGREVRLARRRHFAPWALRSRPRAGGALSPLYAWCALPPSRWRRAPPSRAGRPAPGVLRGRLRADAALPSRAAANLRVVRRARAGDVPPPEKLAVPTARVWRRCRRGGAYGGGRGERWQGGLASNSVKSKALGWWGGASIDPRRHTTACGPSLASFRRQRSTVCIDRDIRVGTLKNPKRDKKEPFVVIEPLLHVTKHRAINSHYATQYPRLWSLSCQTAAVVKAAGCFQLPAQSRRSSPLLCGF